MKRKAHLTAIEIKFISEECPDLSYLDKFEDSDDKAEQEYYNQDQERKENYGITWEMIGINAIATIHIPFEVLAMAGKQINYKIETIDSGGLWGIESDSGRGYFKEIAKDQINILKGYLETLNVDISEFDSLKEKAIEAI